MVKDKENSTSAAVLQFLIAQNRPYAINDLVQSSQLKDHGKAAIQKSLDQLVVAGKVKEKVYGKQKVYVVDQNLVTSSNDPNVNEMDLKIAELSRQISQDEEFIKKAESELKMFNSSMSMEEITRQTKMLLEENEKLKTKLEGLSQNKVKVSASDFKKVQGTKEKVVTELRKRKRICGDMLDQIMEGYPKPKKALLEEIGVTLD